MAQDALDHLNGLAGGGIFTRPADFSAETSARQSFGIIGGEKLMKVRLLFEPKLQDGLRAQE